MYPGNGDVTGYTRLKEIKNGKIRKTYKTKGGTLIADLNL
jgi:hypothetical protein